MGVRECKKERTREELAAAAVALFVSRGYDRTTVEDIAAAVGVSPRTFFRYYPTKEDVVVGLLQSGAVDLRQQLQRRPPAEPLPDALRAATRGWARLSARQAHDLLQVMRVVRTSPTLRARLDDERRRQVDGLAEPIGQRLGLGLDAGEDPRPGLIATLVLRVVIDAIERWSGDGGAGELVDYLDAGLELLTRGIPVAPVLSAT